MSCMKYEVWLAHSLYKGGGRGGGGSGGGYYVAKPKEIKELVAVS